jgi:hypothetical protein
MCDLVRSGRTPHSLPDSQEYEYQYSDEDQDDQEDDEQYEYASGDDIDDEPLPIISSSGPKLVDMLEVEKAVTSKTKELSNVLCIPDKQCAVILRNCGWNVDRAQEKWFSDQDSVLKECGKPCPLIYLFVHLTKFH